MNVAIIGSGNGGSAVAAYLSHSRHSVELFEPAPHIHPDHFHATQARGGLALSGIKGEGFYPVRLYGPEHMRRLKDHDTIIVHFVTNYHDELAEKIAPFVRDDQLIIFNPGYMGSQILYEKLRSFGDVPSVTLAEFETLPFSARLTGPGHVHIRAENKVHPFALWPGHRWTDEIALKLDTFVGRCVRRNDLLEVALHNPNLIMHTVGTIMNASLVEHPDRAFTMYTDGFSPSVWKVVRALDEEKMIVLEALGHPRRSYFEEFQLRTYGRTGLDETSSFKEFASGAFPGPFSMDHRYVTEDVPKGLGLLLALGKRCGVDTPVCASLITLASTMLPHRRIERQVDATRSVVNNYLDRKYNGS